MRKLRPIRHDCSAFAKRAEVLARVEAEAAQIADRTCAAPLVFRAMRLRGVFDDNETMPSSDRHNWIHVGHESVKVNRQYGLCSRRDRSLDRRRIHRPRNGINVHENWLRAGVEYGG